MADKWMDERERREREARRYGRGMDYRREDPGGYDFRFNEGRSFDRDETAARFEGPDRDRVFGERETGANYRTGGAGVGGGEGYSRGGGRSSGAGRSGWQDRNYGGASPAFRDDDHGHSHGRAWQGRDYQGTSPGYAHSDHREFRGGSRGGSDYSQGGRYYGDDDRQPIFREEYGQGGREYGDVPRGYDARQDGWAQDRRDYRQGSVRPAYGGTASGGTGGYDFERGYGDGGRDWDGDRSRGDDPMYRAGEFLNRAGQKISNWFRGDHLMEGSRDDGGYRAEDRSYERDHRGLGPKGYTRSDDRVKEEVCERLADDSWLDASNIDVKVEGSEVTLTGTVDNRQAKHRAERLVEDISGVNHVQNNLRVASNPLTGSGTGFGDSASAAAASRDGSTLGGLGDDSTATRTTTRRT